MPRVIMIFVDGVGIGRKSAAINPFFTTNVKTLKDLFGGSLPSLRDAYRSTNLASLVPINATLGVKGLPQSGTGQTTIMTGLNAPRIIGKHFGPYPYSTLRPLIERHNIFRHLHELGKSVLYVNAFPKRYFEHLAIKKNHITATTLSWISSGFELNGLESLKNGESLSADITGERWNALGFGDVPVLSLYDAGKRLVTLSSKVDFTFYEYFYTDHAGHAQSMEQAQSALLALDGLMEGIVDTLDERTTLVVLTSDHGNIENLSTRSHTRNPVPLLAVGLKHQQFVSSVKTLAQLKPAIMKLFQ